MKKRSTIFLTAVFAGIFFIFSGILVAEDVADTVVIENQGYLKKGKERDRYGAVTFTHKKHATDYKISCGECHHVYKDGKNVWKEGDPVQKCSECHKVDLPNKDKMSLYKAWHSNCKKCHIKTKKKQLKDGKVTVPFKCTGCHKKKKK